MGKLGDPAAELTTRLTADPESVRAAIRTWVKAYIASGREYPGPGAGIAVRLAADSEPMTSACS